MPDSQNHDGTTVAVGRAAAALKSPGCDTKVLWLEIACHVVGPVASGTNTLTARFARLGTSSSTGSLTTSAPGGILTDVCPAKDRTRSLAGKIAAASLWS